jgi:hypothetical protein
VTVDKARADHVSQLSTTRITVPQVLLEFWFVKVIRRHGLRARDIGYRKQIVKLMPQETGNDNPPEPPANDKVRKP